MTEITTKLELFFYATAFTTITLFVMVLILVAFFWKQDRKIIKKSYPKEVDWLLSMDDCQTENMPS